MRNAYRILVGNLKERDDLEELRRRWEDNIRPDLRKIGWEDGTGCIWLRIGVCGRLL
jgi:hypothetical protein